MNKLFFVFDNSSSKGWSSMAWWEEECAKIIDFFTVNGFDVFPEGISNMELLDKNIPIVLFSDLVSSKIKRYLKQLELHSKTALVSVINPLPQRMWRGTILSENLRVNIKAKQANINSLLETDATESWEDEFIPDGLILPLVTTNHLEYLVDLLKCNNSDLWVTGYIFQKFDLHIETDDEIETETKKPQELVNEFYFNASPQTRRLAESLAQDQYEFSILDIQSNENYVDLIQLSELLLTGIVSICKNDSDYVAIKYRYKDGVGELLAKPHRITII
jgi:hypothetical protein